MTKQETINRIRNRINKEYKKHKEIDWQTIAAHKIYTTLFETNLDVIYNAKCKCLNPNDYNRLMCPLCTPIKNETK